MMSEKFSPEEAGREIYDRRDPSPESAMMPKEQMLAIRAEIKNLEEKIGSLVQDFEEMSEDDYPSSRIQLEEAVAKIDDLRAEQEILRDKILTIIDQMDKLDIENLTTGLRKLEIKN